MRIHPATQWPGGKLLLMPIAAHRLCTWSFWGVVRQGRHIGQCTHPRRRCSLGGRPVSVPAPRGNERRIVSILLREGDRAVAVPGVEDGLFLCCLERPWPDGMGTDSGVSPWWRDGSILDSLRFF